jgi:hypothetical protein
MASKELATYKIFKKYGILIDGPEEVLTQLNLKSLPKKKKKETFNQWKLRVFGDRIEIEVYDKIKPSPQTRVSTLSASSSEEHLRNIFEKYGKFKDRKSDEKVKSTEAEVTKRYTTFSKDTLDMLLEEREQNLQEPVYKFMKKYLLKAETNNVDAEEMLSDLLSHFNKAVIEFQKANEKLNANKQLNPTK